MVYWATVTHGIEKINIMPILAIQGGFGSGKSSLMKMLKQICHSAEFVDGKISYPELRDNLKLNQAVLIEEADGVNEDLILKRYSRQTSATSVKRGSASQGWNSKQMDIFGASALHRRIHWKDHAIDSRCIAIKTTYKPGTYTVPVVDGKALEAIASNIDWSRQIPAIAQLNGRAVDTWMPLFQAAYYCNDFDWMGYAVKELSKAIKTMKEGQGYEPTQIIFSALVSLAFDTATNQLKPRVALKDTSKRLKEDGHPMNSWQVGRTLRDLGFQTRLTGGTEYVLIDKAHLLAVAKQLGIDDDLLKQMTP